MDDPLLTKKHPQETQETEESTTTTTTTTRMAVAAAVLLANDAGQQHAGSNGLIVHDGAETTTSTSQEPEEQQSATAREDEEAAAAAAAAAVVDATTTTTKPMAIMSVTMEEVGHLMREQDADLLESHHARGANETNTVLLAPPPPPPPPVVPAAAAAGGGGLGEVVTTTIQSTSNELPAQQVLPLGSLTRQLSTDSRGSVRSIIKGAAAATPTNTPTVRKRITTLLLRSSSSRSSSRAAATSTDGSVGAQPHDSGGSTAGSSGIIISGATTTQLQHQMMIEAQFALQQQQQQQQPMSPTSHQHKRRPTLSGQVFEQQPINDSASSVAPAGAPTAVTTTTAATAAAAAAVKVSHGSAVTSLMDVSALSIHAVDGSAAATDVLMDHHSNNSVGGGEGSVVGESTRSIGKKQPFGRTESMERRLNEMAQFAEAVGIDVPSTVELHINDDEDHDDDDDDDDDDDHSTAAATVVIVATASTAESTTTATVESNYSQKRASLVVPSASTAAATGSSRSIGLGSHPAVAHQEPQKAVMREPRDSPDHHVAAPQRHRVRISSDVGVVCGAGEVAIPSIDGVEGGPTTSTTTATTTTTTTTMKPKIRPPWPFHIHRGFLAQLPDSNTQQDFTYKGIHSNPPEVVKSGSQRGNYAQLHRKAWLEVSDKYHRYGKNLRLYYRYWERLGFPTNSFFDWLDSKGEAAGQPLPELDECLRSTLDADTVLYITNPDISARYAVSFIPDPATGRGRVVDVDGETVATGPDGWIFVLRDNVVYGAPKITSATPGHLSKQRFHHSSFFGGKAVAAAGIFITDDKGFLTRLYPHSGHYRPGEAHIQRMLFYMHQTGVDLRTFEMDMQQILHVAREKDKNKDNADAAVEKKKKIESLYLMPAVIVACYLAHKARFIGQGIFTQIHRIARTEATTVTEALELIDGEGPVGSSDLPPWLMDQG
jgi:hypothetical protein